MTGLSERVQQHRKAMREKGLKRVEVWVPVGCEIEIQSLAVKLKLKHYAIQEAPQTGE